MTGRSRFPRGEPRKASQKRTRLREAIPTGISLTWRTGDRVRWSGQLGFFGRDLDDGTHAEIRIEQRRYRVRLADLSPG
jgi:hypothetical protein